MRQRIALEAARIMDQDGIRDFHAAKRKAAARLDAVDTRNMPSNTEIEQALIEYQRLFRGSSQALLLRNLREAAVWAMEFFAGFEPRLVGSVLSGTAAEHSDVNLHLFADAAEEVAIFLMHHNVPFDTGERRLRSPNGDPAVYPAYRFVAGEISIELAVFPVDGLRQAPRSPVDGRPMRRATLQAVQALLEE